VNTPRGSAAHPLLEEAMRLHQQGNLDQACNFYAEFLQQQPAEAQALRLYGIAARESGQPELSLKLLIQLAQVQPDSVVAYDEIALTYMASGLLDDASRALDHALSIEPNNLRALTNKGALLHFRGHSLEAIQVYREALSVEPTDIEIRCNLAKALAESGDAEQGLIECETAIDESDEHPLAVSVKATILADTGQHKEAAELFESLREYASFDESILINLGFSYQQTGAASAALKAWREAVDINPHNDLWAHQ
jgi:tetratricopeptide (TPR) repeat protein